MNNQIIEKLIQSNDPDFRPEFTYENPVLDRKIARELSKSCVKILRVSQQNSNINTNLRYAILNNIRKMCRMQPENHVNIGDTATNLMTEVYIDEVYHTRTKACKNHVERLLDDFLIRRLKGSDINSNYKSSLNPEVAQSLVNLNESSIEPISQNILHLNVADKRTKSLVRDLWTKPATTGYFSRENICDISLRMKSETEMILLNICHSLLTEESEDLKTKFLSNNLLNLVQKCSISPECFQLCTGILNCLFISINYNTKIHIFTSEFVRNVKKNCSKSISVLYPTYMQHIVVLLDIDVNSMPVELKKYYIQHTVPLLNRIHHKCTSDLLLLLSHYPDWFDIYFNQ